MKIGYFITARLKSTRLNQKILLDLNGKSVLDRVIERCKNVIGIDDVVLCTSTNPQDSVLYDYALKNRIKFYAGSEDDVLGRLLGAAKYFGFDAFLSITADNPMHSFHLGTLIVDSFKKKSFDFVFTNGLPIGAAPYFIKTDALEVAVKMKEESDTEIWGPFVKRPDFFNIGYLNIKNSEDWNTNRLTCDYPEDYKFLRALYSEFHTDHTPSIFEIRDVLLDNAHLVETNQSIIQKSTNKVRLQQIKETFNSKIDLGRQFAKEQKIELNPCETTIEIEF